MDDGNQDGAKKSPITPEGRLCAILLVGLEALAEAGQADAASRLAGHACAALREVDPAQWGRFNILLHRLSRLTGPVGTPAKMAAPDDSTRMPESVSSPSMRRSSAAPSISSPRQGGIIYE